MLTYNIPARKYVYPSLALLLLFLLLTQALRAADATTGASPTRASSDIVNSMNQARDDMDSATRTAIQNAQDRIATSPTSVRTRVDSDRLDSLEDAIRNKERMLRDQSGSMPTNLQGWRRIDANAYEDDDRFDRNFNWDMYDNRTINDRLLDSETPVSSVRPAGDIIRDIIRDTRRDTGYKNAKTRLDERRAKEQIEYTDKRRALENEMTGASRSSNEYARFQKELNKLEQKQTEREMEFQREYRNLDATYSIDK